MTLGAGVGAFSGTQENVQSYNALKETQTSIKVYHFYSQENTDGFWLPDQAVY